MFRIEKKIYFALAIFLLDRILKFFLLKTPGARAGIFINENFAFGVGLTNFTSLFIALLVLLLFAGYALKRGRRAASWFVLLGALSNLLDRSFYGGVVDYLPLPWGAVVNLADILIVAGVIILFLPPLNKKGYAD